jgi:hypothetical protein
MEEALKELVRLKRKRTIAVLGDMLELGGYAVEAHEKLVRFASDLNIDMLIAVGPEMSRAAGKFKGTFYTSGDSDSARSLLAVSGAKETILIKGREECVWKKYYRRLMRRSWRGNQFKIYTAWLFFAMNVFRYITFRTPRSVYCNDFHCDRPEDTSWLRAQAQPSRYGMTARRST